MAVKTNESFLAYLKKKYGDGPYNATDVLIRMPEYGNKIVLIERKYHPLGIAIPGGFHERGLTLEENAQKEAKEETGLEIILDTPHFPRVLSDPKQDPRTQITSTLYTARGFGVLKPAKDEDAKSANLYSIDDLVAEMNSGNLAMPHHKNHLEWYVGVHNDLVQKYG
jgi:8-oxo-dGTP diphosphatase